MTCALLQAGDAFEVEGCLSWSKADRVPTHLCQFKLYVNGPIWSMVLRDPPAAVRTRGEEDFTSDGTNLYYLTYGNDTPLGDASGAITNTSATYLVGNVYQEQDNIPFFDFGAPPPGWSQFLWFAFASADSFRTNRWDSLPGRFCVNRPAPCRLPAQFVRDPLYTNCITGYRIFNPGDSFSPQEGPFRAGFLWQEFRAQSLTNHGAIRIPLAFTVTTYWPKPQGLTTNDVEIRQVEECSITRVVWDAPARDPKPPLPATAHISDYRLAIRNGPAHSYYFGQTWLAPTDAGWMEVQARWDRVAARAP